MSTQAQLSPGQSALDRAFAGVRLPSSRYVGGVVLLAGAYYAAAKLGQTLRYTASVSAIWPPAGLGIAALYLWGLRWWPGIFIAELVVNGELLFESHPLPLGSLLGQQAGNMAEIIVGALLLRHLIGPRAAMDRASEVGGMFAALAVATAISATRRDGLDAGRRRHRMVRGADVLAHVVARRRCGRVGRGAPRARVGRRSRAPRGGACGTSRAPCSSPSSRRSARSPCPRTSP